MKTNPIGIRFEQEEYDRISAYAATCGASFSDVVRQAAMLLVDSNRARGYKSLAQIAQAGEGADVALLFGQFLDDFAHAEDKLSLIADEPVWDYDSGRWVYDFAAAAHKLAHDNGLPVPRWALADRYVADEPLYAFDTENPEFQSYLRATTPREYQWHNLFLGNNILSRA